jgi:cutinase
MNYLPRLPGRAVAVTIAVVAVISAVAFAPRMTVHNDNGRAVAVRLAAQGGQGGAQTAGAPSSYNGTVNITAANTAVYQFNGGGAPGLGLTQAGTLSANAQVHVQCYWVGDAVTGPNGEGANGTDDYWDQIDTASPALPSVPPGDYAVVPDAFVQTSAPVNELVPNCDGVVNDAGGSGNGGGANVGGCPGVDIVFARGTNDGTGPGFTVSTANGFTEVPAGGYTINPDLGYPGNVFVSALQAELSAKLPPGTVVASYAANYNSDVTQIHTADAASDMENHITTLAAQCPNTIFVLGAYSQGAAALDTVLGLGSTVGGFYVKAAVGGARVLPFILGIAAGPIGSAVGSVVGTAAAADIGVAGARLLAIPGLPTSLSGRIAAVVTFGNPIDWTKPTSFTALSATYGPKWKDFCNIGDPVCGNGVNFPAHQAYYFDGSAVTAAQFAAGKVTNGG